MRVFRFAAGSLLLFVACLLHPSPTAAQPLPPDILSELRWRMIGPFRAGRTVAATGVRGQKGLFYVGACNGGVWRTDDYGRTWTPIFDGQPTQSIGALAVAPSDPSVLYVGSGEGLQRPDLSVGDGLYRSTDTGKTWKHLGLRDGQQIGAILVDPLDSRRLFVAVLGHPYGPNPERGVFRSTDGGETFSKVLFRDENTGAVALAAAPSNPKTLYASLWESRQGPWENAEWTGPGSGLYKTADGGKTWRPLTKGLPTFAEGLGRVGVTVAPSDGKRLYAVVEAKPGHGGVFRSDDAGESWRRVNAEERVWGRASDFAEVKVDPRNPDVVWVANTSTYRSTDGGKTFTAVKGAPGGDDYHTIWIDPGDPRTILLASDQGATISLNGGATWSSWYNQPTAQLYHVATDDRFPYWVYGGQQESGSVAIASRGDDGAISFRDWHPVGAEEWGAIAPDPLNPDLVYGGKLTRFSQATRDVQNVSPEPVRTGKHRFLRTAPVVFSPADPRTLYYAGEVLFRTRDGGRSWDVISPDLSREAPDLPTSIGVYRTPQAAKDLAARRRGVIYTVAPSPREPDLIWAGTDDGLIHVTRDGGKTWTNVTPPELTSWSKVSMLEASRFDAGTAYAAVNRFRVDDLAPHVYRTRDGGKTWVEIVKGLEGRGSVNAIREDPVRKGLLYAATELGVSVSFDDGGRWQPLQQNLPATSARDLVVHGDDLVVGTHGRSFWILSDVTPLRQLGARLLDEGAHLFAPQAAYRIRRNRNTDTPLPPEEPVGQNPPDGAILDYWLKEKPAGPVTLEFLDGAGRLVRRYASDDTPEPVASDLDIPTYWVRPARVLSAEAGLHRFVWDLCYLSPPAEEHEYPISAIYRDTPRGPDGPLVLPGTYTARLTVNGKVLERLLVVKMDPRVATSAEGLAGQLELAQRICAALREDDASLRRLRAKAGPTPSPDLAKLEAELARLSRRLVEILDVVESTDAAPTDAAAAAAAELERMLAETVSRTR